MNQRTIWNSNTFLFTLQSEISSNELMTLIWEVAEEKGVSLD